MRYVAAYMLAALGGKSEPSKDDITKILSSVGISVDDEKLKIVLDNFKGKRVADVVAEGQGKLASVPAGGGGVAAAAPAGGDAPAAGKDVPEKKEEKKAEESEESDDDMGFGLFD
ncbi:unnamed protein product [Cyprideis torosa]|uniref:Large ribosomal subunit protein P2 n=1 Tax=Cyprideis torosa TaxID=163714 RepID=A0A7R8ZJG9_9CRUS|nr:unnamed protein product [Cyprideis torosa]CAG0888644.1 unnamed protein product [Cyprideis torosa]